MVNSANGTDDLAPARFTVSLAPPPNTPPRVALTGVAAGATYEKGQVPAAGCLVQDAEDGNPAVVPDLSPITGGQALFGIGAQTATCAYTDRGGLTTVLGATYYITDTTAPTITGGRTPPANSFGWNDGPVEVRFACADNPGGSGVGACGPGVTLEAETTAQGQTVAGVAVDNAGNISTPATVGPIKIDLTPPTLVGATTAPANAAGWYRGDVTVHWTAQDGLSGIDPATQPADDVITGEGAALVAGPASVADRAGNVGTASVTGIRIDRTPPTIAATTTASPNSSGWYNRAVAVHFTCEDALSGVVACASDVVLDRDGTGQSAAGAAEDAAGNRASATIDGINVDSRAPATGADVSCTGANGWCRGNAATVVLSAADQPGLSGVESIRYSVNGGPWQTAPGAAASVRVPLAARSGLATIHFYAVDRAGNSEAPNGAALRYDNIAPTVSHALNPDANADGWNSTDVTVRFTAVDDSDGSGVDPTTITPDQSVTAETAGTRVDGQAKDMAGNLGTDAVVVKLDKTAPSVSGAATNDPNASGWYNGPVTVRFVCADTLSGVATCPADRVLADNGAGQSVTGTAADRAGNVASATVGGINIDAVAPTVAVAGVADGAVYTLGAVPATSCTASDQGAGLDGGCTLTVSGGAANGVGTFAYTATATDRAGNTASVTGSYRVVYRWDGFLQPINDTAHQVGAATSIFKAGGTVPAKLQLRTAAGTPVQAGSPPQWLTPVRGVATTAPVDEAAYADAPTAGGAYRWDDTAQQYIFNWGTAKNQVGYYWRIGVRLDDGQTYYANVGLR
jgi:hypothetical protein